jgi:hypothetical protein
VAAWSFCSFGGEDARYGWALGSSSLVSASPKLCFFLWARLAEGAAELESEAMMWFLPMRKSETQKEQECKQGHRRSEAWGMCQLLDRFDAQHLQA